ncbi:MAG: hypothetical protein ACRYG8_11095 [Janthinobacterium lividum]
MSLDDDPWWWFSFFDIERRAGERFLGAAVVQARSQEIAVMALARFGCDPGGEARCTQIPAELGTPPKLYRERLLGLDEARKLADLMETWRPGRQVNWLNT